MKKGLLSLAVALGASLPALAAGNDDPVLMTVNKTPVHLSEFEYLYQKNNAQQLTEQPVDEYVDLFVIYKLKVAAAEAEGIDRSDAFRTEYEGYIRDLSTPYLTDRAASDSLVRLIYDRMKEEVDVSHIMIPRAYGAKAAADAKAGLATLRDDILAGRRDFAAVADSISIDPQAKRNHGHMGVMTGGAFPYTFEDAAYTTAVGEISPVVETPFGYHIVKVNNRHPSKGEVHVKHILKLTANTTPEVAAQKKQQIDSIYALLQGGADFSLIAMTESEDPGSARRGGELDWFGSGRMVPEFEEVAFALADGEMSAPFKTSYGYHIIQRLGSRGIDSFENLRPRIEAFVARDERQYIPQRVFTSKLKAKYGLTTDEALAGQLRQRIASAATVDSTLIAPYANDSRVIIDLAGDAYDVTVADLFADMAPHFKGLEADTAVALFDERLEQAADNAVTSAERANLAEENADYRNLLHEYRDGMLLFEISDRNVWSRAKNDRDGLNRYFEKNRNKYATWTAPKYKASIVFFPNDSLMADAQKYLAENPCDRSQLADVMRERYGKEVRVERVIAAQGENAIIDALAFGGEKPEPTGKWVAYFPYGDKIINQPEEPDDDRGVITTDYQNYLEQEWIKQLRKKFPVKVDQKVLKAYKESLEKK